MNKNKPEEINISVLGDGGWGTALSLLLARKNFSVTLWSAFSEYAKLLEKTRENKKFLPGIRIPKSVKITSDLNEALSRPTMVVLAIPTKYLRETLSKLKGFDFSGKIIISATKGIENETLLRPSEIISSVLGKGKIVVLSGPSHSEEVARGIPTCVVVASEDLDLAKYVQNIFMEGNFRVYASEDVAGVELGGALKNVIAIAAGVSDGLNFGSNTKAALLSRGIVEITRLGSKLGGNPNTFFGLSGLGDLITTGISEYSRNRKVGVLLGKGKKLKEILKNMEMVAEGIYTARSAQELSRKHDVETPIIDEVCKILYEDKDPAKAVGDLMQREAKTEMECL